MVAADDGACVLNHDLSGCGEGGALGAAVEELGSEAMFGTAEGSAGICLRRAHDVRSGAHAAVFVDCDE